MAASRGAAGVEVLGVRNLRKTMKAAGSDLEDLAAANKAAAEMVAARARQLVPTRSGRLKSTIRAGGGKTRAIVRAGNKRTPYAGPIHWGWAKRNIKSNPFISVAAQETERQWVVHYIDAVNKAVLSVKGI